MSSESVHATVDCWVSCVQSWDAFVLDVTIDERHVTYSYKENAASERSC